MRKGFQPYLVLGFLTEIDATTSYNKIYLLRSLRCRGSSRARPPAA
jgi:hypothetical protein